MGQALGHQVEESSTHSGTALTAPLDMRIVGELASESTLGQNLPPRVCSECGKTLHWGLAPTHVAITPSLWCSALTRSSEATSEEGSMGFEGSWKIRGSDGRVVRVLTQNHSTGPEDIGDDLWVWCSTHNRMHEESVIEQRCRIVREDNSGS